MANTALLQAVTQMLMQGRPPSPMAPIPSGGFTPPGGLGSLMPILEAPPPVAPVAPMPARDDALIALLSGSPPVAPTPQPDSLIQQISRALLGVSAGVEGRGPQFLAGLQEQRERPQREFRAATEQFEDRRRGAIQFEEGLRQRERAGIQSRADIQSDRDFDLRKMEVSDRMQEARDLRRQADAIEREERRAQKEKEEQDRKDKAAKEKEKRNIEFKLGEENFAPPQVAKEIAAFIVDGTPMSASTEKWRSVRAQKLEAQLARLKAAGTGSGKESDNAASLVRRFNSLKAQFLRAEQPTKSMPFGDRALQQRIAAQYPAVMDALAKLGYEVGFDPSGVYPYQKPPQGQQQAQPTAPQAQASDPGDIKRFLRQ